MAPPRKCIYAVLYAKPDKLDATMDQINKIKEGNKSEPGTLTYRSLVDRENSQVIMFEEYASQQALDEHMKGEGYQTLVARSSELFVKAPLLRILDEF